MRCALCHQDDDGDLTKCHRCGVATHFECFEDLGGGKCPTPGCVPLPPTLRELLVTYEKSKGSR
jgi:hypothetical protein